MPIENSDEERKRVLIIGAGHGGSDRLASAFRAGGYELIRASGVDSAILKCGDRSIAGVVWALPQVDIACVEQLQVLRGLFWGTSIIAVLAASSETDRCALLGEGADDCVDDSCGDREIVHRLAAHARRISRARTLRLVDGSVILDNALRRLKRLDCTPSRFVDLTDEQFKVCRLLAERFGETVAHSIIEYHVWQRDMSRDKNTVYRLMARLRSRVDQLGGGIVLASDPGRGYRLDREPARMSDV
jgi:DNA-binding response OmpR family regulator